MCKLTAKTKNNAPQFKDYNTETRAYLYKGKHKISTENLFAYYVYKLCVSEYLGLETRQEIESLLNIDRLQRLLMMVTNNFDALLKTRSIAITLPPKSTLPRDKKTKNLSYLARKVVGSMEQSLAEDRKEVDKVAHDEISKDIDAARAKYGDEGAQRINNFQESPLLKNLRHKAERSRLKADLEYSPSMKKSRACERPQTSRVLRRKVTTQSANALVSQSVKSSATMRIQTMILCTRVVAVSARAPEARKSLRRLPLKI